MKRKEKSLKRNNLKSVGGKNGLILFVRNPELGKVKTRIAEEKGDEIALKIYCELLSYTEQIVSNVKAEKLIFYTESVGSSNFFKGDEFHTFLQKNGDLGEKITQAFSEAFKVYDKLVIIGSDCPQITANIIEEAFSILDTKDLAIGPTLDGGFYLLGLNNIDPNIFKEIEWSTSSVFAKVKSNATSLNYSIGELRKLSDVDYWADWEKYGWGLE